MPWQRYVADTALEIDPASGRLKYRTVVITVPRQSGKTTLLLSLMVHRAIGFGQRQNIVYTAQTQKAARKKWEEEHVELLNASPFHGKYSVRYGMERALHRIVVVPGDPGLSDRFYRLPDAGRPHGARARGLLHGVVPGGGAECLGVCRRLPMDRPGAGRAGAGHAGQRAGVS